jgi:programmed cell death protein 5
MNDDVSLEEMKKIEELKKIILKKVLSREAFERLGRIKLVKPELASQLELYLVQLHQSGKLKENISDEQLKMLLETLTSGKSFKIIK